LEKSSFFNSIAGDRKYQASDFAAFFSSLLTNGVFPDPSTNLQVMSNGDMTVTIKVGKAWVNGYVYINDSDLILPVTVADGVLKRIDRVVIQYSTINREIKIKIKKGTFASSPVAPILQRDADIYELGIADISIVNGSTSITQANITDLRLNTTYCGWVNSLIQADTTAIFNQYQAWFTAQSSAYNTQMAENEVAFQTQFDEWFATVQNQLSGDIAGNLQNQITDLSGTGRTTETVKGNADALVTHKADDVRHVTAADRTKWGATDNAKFKKGNATYTDNDTSQTFTDTFSTANSLVTVVITSATPPKGIWTVNSADGSFSITSTVAEDNDITFDYYIQKAVG
jgi:hypothetical protein